MSGRPRHPRHRLQRRPCPLQLLAQPRHQRRANEVKYVRGYGQAIPKTVVEADHYLLSPAFEGMEVDPRALDWCIRLCKENPPWRLSVQQHKLWRVR